MCGRTSLSRYLSIGYQASVPRTVYQGRIQDLGEERALHIKFMVNSKMFFIFPKFTVNFKDFLQIRGGSGWSPLGSALVHHI
jgi:hypothetical protein